MHERSAPPCESYEVSVAAMHGYRVRIEPGLLARYGRVLKEAIGPARLVVLTDRRVDRLYGATLRSALDAAEYRFEQIVLPPGEPSKSLASFGRILHRMADLGIDRRAVLVAFGGGLISDVGGFAASAYMRGIRYVNLSTSLLGQVDAMVGGKVAVNAPHAKNLFGAFHHPSHVAADPELLASLSARDFRSGLAESIKVAIIGGPDLFALLEREHETITRRDAAVLTRVIAASTRLKSDMLALDPYEADLRRPLNFGHTLGHPIETEFAYKRIRHGEAVALGMGVATAIALQRGSLAPEAGERIFALLRRYDLLGYDEPIRPDGVIEHMRFVRLIRGCKLNFVLPIGIGGVEITGDLSDAEIVRGFERYEGLCAERRGPS